MEVCVFKYLPLLMITMPIIASSPATPVVINPHRQTTETITITVNKDSPSTTGGLMDTNNSLTAHRSHPPKQVELRHPCCNTKVKLALISATATIVTAGISAAATYYTKSCT